MPSVVVVLECMWDDRYSGRVGPAWYRINPRNHSGSRLIKWIGHKDFLVTNACPEIVGSASAKTNPSELWLKRNMLRMQPFNLALVCGKVAQRTYDNVRDSLSTRGQCTIYLPHPAARSWKKAGLERVTKLIQSLPTRDYHVSFDKKRASGIRIKVNADA